MVLNPEDYILLQHGTPDSGRNVNFFDKDNTGYFGWCDDFNSVPSLTVFFDNASQSPVDNVKAWAYWNHP